MLILHFLSPSAGMHLYPLAESGHSVLPYPKNSNLCRFNSDEPDLVLAPVFSVLTHHKNPEEVEMINEDKLRELLRQQESQTLDFKRDAYLFDSPDSNSKFVKDILAMANTPRDEAALFIAPHQVHPR